MKFERLRLTGFKSFCDAAEFRIEAGLDRRRRAERLRQVEPRRGSALGDGRKLVQEHARLGHGGRDLRRLRQASLAQHRRGRAPARQLRPPRAGRLQRFRVDRGHQAHRTRRGFDLSRQRQGSARARRAAPVRRRVDRRALALAGAPGADRGDHRGEAPGPPADPRRGRGRLRPPLAPPRSRAQAEGRGRQSHPGRGRAQADRRPGRQPQAPGASVEPLPRSLRDHPPPRGARPPHRLARA